VPWTFLKQAADRSTAVAIVLDRTAPEAVQTVATHLARMLAARGLKDSPLFVVHEGSVDEEGLLPPAHVAEVRGWLDSLAADSGARGAVVRQTLDGAIRSLTHHVHPVADAAAAQVDAAEHLRRLSDQAYSDALDRALVATADGTLMRGEILARWQEFVGTGELLRSLETKVGWLRDRVVGAVKGKPQQAERVTVAVESGLELLVLEHAEQAAEAAERAWKQQAAGAALLAAGGPELGRASRDLRRRAERAVREWQTDVLDMVRAEGEGKRTTARFLALGVNGLSVALMVVVFSHTAGLTGAEAGIAGGSAALGQKLLEAVFGDQAVRGMAERARLMLEERVTGLMATEQARWTALVDGLGLSPEVPEQLRAAARRVDDVRFSSAQREH
jgi:hypothetical protein